MAFVGQISVLIMDILTVSFLLLLGAAAGSWLGYSQGLAQGKQVGKLAGIKEGIKEQLRKELIESKIIGGAYEVKVHADACKELEAALSGRSQKKAPASSLPGWVVVAGVLFASWLLLT